MKALTFFILLDRLGRRLGYFTIVIPFLAAIYLVRNKSAPRAAPSTRKRDIPEVDRFSIEE